MTSLRLRGLDVALQARIRSIARTERISLNRAALLLLRRGAGLEDGSKSSDVIGNSLDRFIGDWSEEEALEFEQAVAVFAAVDVDAWK